MLQINLLFTGSKVFNNNKMTFNDNVPVILEDNLKDIVAPLFTARELGENTGPGSSARYGRVEGHGDHIYASSKPGNDETRTLQINGAPEEQHFAEQPGLFHVQGV
jgi:hypothetical protein